VARRPTKKPENSKRQRFTPEYKLEAVRLSEDGTKSIAAVAADLGIAANQLHRWRRQHADRGLAAFPGNGKIHSHDEELHRLRRDLRQVTEERDFLKNCPRARSAPHVHRNRQCRSGDVCDHAGEWPPAFWWLRPRRKTWSKGSFGPSCGGTLCDPV
jgi:transposase